MSSTTKYIFITGAAAGIGKACAQAFHREGWHVGLYDIDKTGCQKLAEELGNQRVTFGRLDVTDPLEWKNTLSAFCEVSGGQLHGVLNNAGVLSSGEFQDIDLETQHRMVDINVKGVMNGCHLAFPYLRDTPQACLINMASASAIYGQADLATYSSSKFFVRGLTEALDLEWSKYDIRVVDIWPLFVRTAMIDNLDKAQSVKNMGVKLTPDDVAKTVIKAATYRGAIPKVHWTVGFSTKALYQAVKMAPLWLTRQINQRLTRAPH
ncbi:MAG: SDR family oxidoreductase [Oceanococcus sp.]|nr:MAG: SDR family oxidoreductase [Oceanococcus sp.]